MSSIGAISASPFIAASLRMQATANDIGKVSPSDAAGEVAPSGGVQPFQPDARFAANYGLLSGPDVDLAGEVIEHLISSTSLIAIAQVIRADSKMIESLLDIKA